MSGKTALVFAGCGGRAILQAGMCKAVIESQMHIDMVFGCSAGALNGAIYQQGDWDVAEKTWLEIKTSNVYESNPLTWAGALTGKSSVYSPKPLKKLINGLVDFNKQQINDTPFHIIATDMTNRKPITMQAQKAGNKEDLVDFLLASASPPIFFPPVNFKGNLLNDGGLANCFSISNAIAEGADTLIILRPTPKYLDSSPKNIVQMIGLTIGIATESYLDRELLFVNKLNQINDEKYRDIKVILITCPNYGIDLLDFDYKGLDRRQLMQAGYNQAQRVLSQV